MMGKYYIKYDAWFA